jgi:hypothetical protein
MTETTIFLQQFSKFDCIGQLDLSTGAWHEYSKSAHPEIAAKPWTGVFEVIDKKRLCLFRWDRTLTMWAQGRIFAITDDVTSSWDLIGVGRAVFRLEKNSKTTFELEFAPFQSRKPIPGDETPFVDEEDYDFLIFVHHVLSDPARRARIYGGR